MREKISRKASRCGEQTANRFKPKIEFIKKGRIFIDIRSGPLI
jgi:hypothetical protein